MFESEQTVLSEQFTAEAIRLEAEHGALVILSRLDDLLTGRCADFHAHFVFSDPVHELEHELFTYVVGITDPSIPKEPQLVATDHGVKLQRVGISNNAGIVEAVTYTYDN